jgi:acyl-CoA reductase-like NAD-dependent aldehyde dehydrogenase
MRRVAPAATVKESEMAYKLLIDGALVDGAGTLDVINPATGKVFAEAPRADLAQLEQAVASAKRAFPAWAAKSHADRRALLEQLADAVDARAEEFIRLLVQEQGKPRHEAAFEVGGVSHNLRHYAHEELLPRVLVENENERIVEHRAPLGVVAAIAPWNFPIVLLAAKLAPALITGNVVIGKPAPTTPLTTLLLGEVAAGILPAGVFQTIVDANDLGGPLSSHPDVAYVNFTGSTGTGKKVLASAADTLKRFTLELGGNDVAILLDDVDVAAIAPKIYQSAMGNAGQVCLATKRVYAPEALYDELCDALGKLASEAIVGDGLEQGTQMGPIQNKQQYEKLLGYLDEARKSGTIVAGGNAVEGDGYFIRPTIVRDIPATSPLVREEQFGPILPVMSYTNLEDAIADANDSDYGLGGSVWGGDVDRAAEVAERIHSGTVWVNRHLVMPMEIPFGGAKQSLYEVTQLKIVSIGL